MSRMRGWTAAALLALGACGDDGTGPTGAGTMTATIDGAAWSATASLEASWTDQRLLLVGKSGDGRRIRLSVPGVTTFALHKLGEAFPATGELLAGDLTWSTTHSGGDGHVHVTAISAAGATGTFAFVAREPQLGGTARAVTTGTFAVSF